MEKIIIYGTQYGTTRRYAEELSRQTGIKVVSYEDIKSIDEYTTIIYIGALYAGGVLGMSKTLKGINNLLGKNIIIVTVGLADPNDKENIKNIKSGMIRQLPPEILENAKIYHLRGGIDYSKLNFKHRTMMGLLYKKAKNLPDERKTAEVRAMIDTYNSKVDFVDYNSLNSIIEDLTSKREMNKPKDDYSR